MLALRLVMGLIFIVHGAPKLRNLKETGIWLGSEGFRPGIFWALMLGLLEVFGGLALIIGFTTELFGLLFTVEMIIAALWKMKKKMGLVMGYELDLALAAAAFVIATLGPGIYSVAAYL